MATITLAIADDLKKEMDDFKELNWSEVARSAIKDKIGQLKLLKQIASKSKLTDKEAIELGRKLNKSMHERYKGAN